MHVTRLAAENFLSYETLDLPLEDLSQAGIVGANGAGKSALLDMLTWSLFGVGRGSADELMREGADLMAVTVGFTLAGREYEVRRERSKRTARGESTLTLTVDGERQTAHSIPETQGAILKHLGLGLDALLAGPIMVQADEDDPHDLMHLKQAARMDLLIELFGLARFEAYHARAKEWLARADADRDSAERRITELDELISGELEARRERDGQKAAVDALEAEVERLTEEITAKREEAAALLERASRQEALEETLAKAQSDLDAVTIRLSTYEEQIKARRQRLDRKPVLPPTNDVKAIDEQLAKVLPEIVRLPDLREKKGILETRWRAAKSQIKTLATVPCQNHPDRDHPSRRAFSEQCLSCRFLTDAVDAGRNLEAIREDGLDVAAKIEALEEKSRYADELARERREAADQLAQHRRDAAEREGAEEYIAAVTAQVDDAKNQIERLSEAVRTANAERMRLAQDVEKRERLVRRLTTLTEELKEAQTERAGAQRRLNESEVRVGLIVDAKRERTGLGERQREMHNRAAALRLLVTAFHRDGIPKLILENGLPMIEERANEILDRMPGSWKVEIATQRALKTGGTAEALDVIITAAGVERPYRMLSGGERFRVDFALRMALATVLARRSGTQVETLWLDEGWGSQDREGREALLEAIASVSDEFRLMLIVSHVPEVTDAMPQRIEVTKTDGVSSAEVAA